MVMEDLETSSFSFHFEPARELSSVVIYVFGCTYQLVDVVRTTRADDAQCTSHFAVADAFLDEEGGSGTDSSGICGVIATIHSLVELSDLDDDIRLGEYEGQPVSTDEATSGGNLSVKGLKTVARHQKHRSGMTFRELREAHASGGASNCKQPPGPFKTGDAAAMKKLIKDLAAYVNSTKPDWDCTLLVRSSKLANGTYRLSHWEHVKSMKVDPDTGTATVTTTDGLNQGRGNHRRIPAVPGDNTWELTPGQKGRLAGGTRTARRLAARGGWGNDVTTVSYVCCSAPAE
jgi:hypothetical protein